MEYLPTDLPQYVTVTSRTALGNSVVAAGHVLLFSEDGESLTAKLPDGSFVNVGGGGDPVLPYKRELAYLESSGTQWIDTGIIPTSATGVVGRWMSPDDNVEMYLFSADNFYAPIYNDVEEMPSAIFNFCGSTAQWDPEPRDRTSPHVTGLNYMTSGSAVYESYREMAYAGSSTPQFTGIMFRYRNPGDGQVKYGGSGRIYWLRVSQGYELVRDFIPVMDNNDVPCFYDRVTGTLFYNAGTGSFAYGEIQS